VPGLVSAACTVLGGGCAIPHDAEAAAPAKLELVPLTDTNPDEDVVEVELVAAEGTARYLASGEAEVWGYRDGAVPDSKVSVPGPLLEVERGQSVIVHFRNELPEGTTIHWHGLRVPNASDGTPSVQAEVAPGESFDYRFVASDAGTFWYHPHVRSDTQIERGLHGMVIVHGGADIPVDAERAFVLDDVKLEATGKLSTQTAALDVMLGRQGNVVLANGVRRGRVIVRSGARERWRFVNTANGRFFNLRLSGRRMKVIGWDGGLIPQPYDVETLLITPGERYEVLVEFHDPQGTELALETVHYDRGHHIPDPGPLPVFEIAVEGAAPRLDVLPAISGEPVRLVVSEDAVERELTLSEEEGAPDGFPRFFVNGREFPDVPAIESRVGNVEIWRVHNDTEMDHPFHLHGMFFRILDIDGRPPEHEGWKDTANVPQKAVLRFAVRYDDVGTWMYHCHILEHAERGMMGELKLVH
jgi:FtsP/CotA-like multicopper oxidase with cupredoxin domain